MSGREHHDAWCRHENDRSCVLALTELTFLFRRPASRPEEQDAWYMYDDDKPAQLLKPEQVSSQIAYVLCYCRSTRRAQEAPSA